MNQLTIIKEAFAAQLRILNGTSEYRQHEVFGVPVVIQDDAVKMATSLFAVATKNSFGFDSIFISEEFLTLNENVQRFIVLHEQGHIFYYHLNITSWQGMKRMMHRTWLQTFNKVHATELQADMFAAQQMGIDNAIEALIDLKYLVKERYGKKHAAVKEINNRIEALKYS